jgi:hypothetical protein
MIISVLAGEIGSIDRSRAERHGSRKDWLTNFVDGN